MSFVVCAYLVDPGQFQTLVGSKNHTLLADVEQAFAELLVEDETPHEVWVVNKGATEAVRATALPRVPTLRQALHALVRGEIPTSGDGSQYGYALEMLCQYLGTSLSNQPFDGFSGFPEDFAYGHELDAWRPPIPLPWPHDALAITHVPSAQAARRLAEIPAIALTAPLYWDDMPAWDEETMERFHREWSKRLHTQYRAWLEESVRTGKDLVTIMH